MVDRRMVTDVALAALIAFPAALPASHMRSAVIQIAHPLPAAQLAYSGPGEARWSLRAQS